MPESRSDMEDTVLLEVLSTESQVHTMILLKKLFPATKEKQADSIGKL